jgi:hypothetical protein
MADGCFKGTECRTTPPKSDGSFGAGPAEYGAGKRYGGGGWEMNRCAQRFSRDGFAIKCD